MMSYVHGYASKPLTGTAGGDNFGYVAGPMAFDIAAIQFLYGANTSYRTGSAIYVLPTTNAAHVLHLYLECGGHGHNRAQWHGGGDPSIYVPQP